MKQTFPAPERINGLWVIYHTQPTIPLFLVFKWRHGGHVGVQNSSAKSLLGIWGHCLVQQYGPLITWVKTKNSLWRKGKRSKRQSFLHTIFRSFTSPPTLKHNFFRNQTFLFQSKRILHEDANIKIWFSYLLRKTECLAKTQKTFFQFSS